MIHSETHGYESCRDIYVDQKEICQSVHNTDILGIFKVSIFYKMKILAGSVKKL